MCPSAAATCRSHMIYNNVKDCRRSKNWTVKTFGIVVPAIECYSSGAATGSGFTQIRQVGNEYKIISDP